MHDWDFSPPLKEDTRRAKSQPKHTRRIQFSQDEEDEGMTDEPTGNDQYDDDDEVLLGALSKPH